MTATLTSKTMTQAEAAWVRDHVFTPKMRGEYKFAPHRFTSCPCFQAAYPVCTSGNHDRCPRTNGTTAETYLYLPSSLVPSATGDTLVQVTSVWRVGRPCRSRCGCDCHSRAKRRSAAATAVAAAPAPETTRTWPPLPVKASKGEQLSLLF